MGFFRSQNRKKQQTKRRQFSLICENVTGHKYLQIKRTWLMGKSLTQRRKLEEKSKGLPEATESVVWVKRLPMHKGLYDIFQGSRVQSLWS